MAGTAGEPRPVITDQAAVLGYPIGHSLSPALHRAAYRELGLTGWSYRALECTQERFLAWFPALSRSQHAQDPHPDGPRWAGLSLTMPLKQVVLPLLDDVSALAQDTGSVNTVVWHPDGSTSGDNTDVHGVRAALVAAGVGAVTGPASACLVGAGATAGSAVAALAGLGCRELTVQARSAQRARPVLDLAERMGLTVRLAGLEETAPALAADVTVSTLPVEPAATWAADLAATGATPRGVLLDVLYHPWPPPVLQAWEKLGGRAVGGFEMLLAQAGEQVRLMTGRDAPLEVMRAAAQAELARDDRSA